MSIQTILNKWVGKTRDDCLEKDDFCDGHQEGYNQALAELRSKIPQIEKEILEEIMFIEAPEVSEEMQKNIKEHSKYLVGWIEAKKHIINQLKSK